MKKICAIVIGLLAACSTSFVFAATDFNKTILKIGAQGTVAYIQLSPALTIGPAGTCQYDIIYVADTTTASGKAYFATLLTAYSQGKPLSRVDYLNAGGVAGNVCNLTLVEVS